MQLKIVQKRNKNAFSKCSHTLPHYIINWSKLATLTVVSNNSGISCWPLYDMSVAICSLLLHAVIIIIRPLTDSSWSLVWICLPLKNHVMVLTGSDATRQTIETFLPLGTVKYIEVGDNWGAHANSAKLKLWMWMPKSLLGPWHEGSTILGTLLWVSHRRKLRNRQSQVHLE